MIVSYLKIAYRSFIRTRLYSFINVLGLTLGITCCSLLALYILNELDFDKNFREGDQIGRLVYENHENAESVRFFGIVPGQFAVDLKDNYAEVKDYIRVWRFIGHLDFTFEDKKFSERSWYMVEKNFTNYFDLELIYGDKEIALSDPNSILLAESTAIQYFGEEDPMGKILHDDVIGDLKVTGVFKDVPQNTHLQFKILISPSRSDDNWKNALANYDRLTTYSYVVFESPQKMNGFSEKLNDFVRSKYPDDPNAFYSLQPLEEVHFNSASIEYGADTNGGEFKYIIIFLSIGVFIILIASINYMNLATAKSMKRAKEIGVRKANGAMKNQLFIQFMFEAMLISSISFLFSLGLVDLLIPFFNLITGKQFTFSGSDFQNIAGLTFLFSFLVGILSGIYPSFYLSSFKPANILKGDSKQAPSQLSLRKGLVITQFALSIFMIISTLVVYKQLDYMNSYDLGFDKEQMVVIDINGPGTRNGFAAMKTELLKNPEIESVAVSTRVPGEWKNIMELYIHVLGHSDSLQSYYMGFDEDMIPTYNMEIVQGANFEGLEKLDSTRVILNETAAKQLGIENDPVNQKILVQIPGAGAVEFTVTGIVKDFNYQSLHTQIQPLMIGYWNSPLRVIDYFSARITGNNVEETIAHMTKVHEIFEPNSSIEYHFLDNQINNFYQTEAIVGKVFLFGAGFTIFIACLGLFGLASFVTEMRTKEIGIRKALGATYGRLYIMISYSFIKNVLIAWLIATPVAIFLMNKWLNLFTFRTELGISIFAVSGLIALLISLLTVSYRSLKAARTNPINSLRYE